MTQEEEKEVIRVCGPNYEESDIPTFIRNRDTEREKESFERENAEHQARLEEIETEEFSRRADLDAEREKAL